MDWTDEVIERLRAFWAEGHSTAEIGRRMGVSKNAVVGKAHRLGLTARPSPIRRGAGADAPRRAPIRRAVGPTLPPLSSPAEPYAFGSHPRVGPHDGQVSSPSTSSLRGANPSAPLATSGARSLDGSSPAAAALAAPPPRVSSLPSPGVAPNAASHSAPVHAVHTPNLHAPSLHAPSLRAVTRAPGGRVIPCCWPIGEPGTRSFRFCDAASAAGKPYCAEHAALAYVKIRDRREDAA